jgi:hypothetical protein
VSSKGYLRFNLIVEMDELLMPAEIVNKELSRSEVGSLRALLEQFCHHRSNTADSEGD